MIYIIIYTIIGICLYFHLLNKRFVNHLPLPKYSSLYFLLYMFLWPVAGWIIDLAELIKPGSIFECGSHL